MSIWVIVAATLLGTVLGGIVGIINTRMQAGLQINRDRQKLILGKLEELHEVLSQFRRGYGDLSYLAASNAGVEALMKQRSAIPKERLQMLVGFYAPDLSDELRRIGARSREYDAALSRFSELAGAEGEKREDLIAEAVELKRQLDQACLGMQSGVIALSRNYL